MLTASGIGNKDVWDAVLQEKQCITDRPYRIDAEQTGHFPVYGIGAVHIKNRVSASVYEMLEHWGLSEDNDFCYLVVAIQQALWDAKLQVDGNAAISLVIGHENLGIVDLVDKLVEAGCSLKQSGDNAFLHSFKSYQHNFFHIQTFPYLFYLAKIFGINGFTYAVNNACASGLYALELGRQLIASGSTDVVIVACSDYAHVSEYLWMNEKGAMSRNGTIRPFDRDRDGLVLGDGGAALVLESSNHAAKRRVPVLCEYAGGSFAQDAWHLTLPDVGKHTYSSVISQVLRYKAKAPVDLFVPHGTGSPLWDRYEASEITRALQETAHLPPRMTAFKGYIGHTLGASSMLETLLLLQCMKHNLLPRALNYSEPDGQIDWPIARATEELPIHTVVKAVPAYGGFHAACLFKKMM
jgi:3-oxoacyl-(acyl-carrier-protein) synthase